ncbi:putative HTH-type transcriptional regulator [Zhongshania aliphaticivorans]|uniref:Putative HTH-type transcriptional regulator n=1 Tax=Zhongshania aliphaticivorans TaxID=1470434 RepID=A0A5S9PZL0_9GAMM|nr:AraC family transcriptional regulator [Zhongshania aliphaticivorans]CAA0110641.1 putative HTH-type transcriptional regulator [Zhongshania aliphaticivorans]CAA0118228.1 putative HTH-type transcriptional regulator [Zhongshania aliphaticivorans]
MELLLDNHVGEKMLTHLHQTLINEYPKIVPGELALACNLPRVSWWTGGSPHPLQDFIDLFRYLTEDKAPEIGYFLTRQAQLTDLGMMGYAMMTAATVRDFVLVAGYSLDQFGFPVEVTVQTVGEGLVALVFSEHLYDKNYFDSFLEFSMALSWHYIEVILPPDKKFSPTKVCFSFSKNIKQKSKASVFYRSDIEYQSELNAIILPAEAFNAQLAVGTLSEIVSCSLQCNQILNNTRSRGRFHKMVERALIEAPHICKFSFIETAKYLEINGRSLRSHLESERANFREISLNVRMQLAQEYLKSTSFPIKHIAYILSYTEPNNFIRAFTKFTGVSPSKYRL